MAVRLVNKSKADCDINLYSGETVRLKPSSYIVLKEKITKSCVDYYRQLSDLGLYLVEDPEEPVKVEVAVEEQVTESPAEEQLSSEEEAEILTAMDDEVVEETPEMWETVENQDTEESVEEQVTVTVEDLMKFTRPELVEMAKSYGITELEGYSKKMIADKIIEAANAR